MILKKAEGKGNHQVFPGGAVQIFRRCRDDGGIVAKEGCQKSAEAKRQHEHHHAKAEGNALCQKQRPAGAAFVPGAHVLRHKSGQGGHERHGHDGKEYV